MVVKNFKRRITSGVLALLMVLTMLPTNVAYAAESTADSSAFAKATVSVWYTYDVKATDADGSVTAHADTVTGFRIDLNGTDLTASDVADYGVAYATDESANTWYYQSAKSDGANHLLSQGSVTTYQTTYSMEVYGCSNSVNASIPAICSGVQYSFVPYYVKKDGTYVYGKKTEGAVLEAADTVVMTGESLYGKGDGKISLVGNDEFLYLVGDSIESVFDSESPVENLSYGTSVKIRPNAEATAFGTVGIGAYNYIDLNCTDDLKDHYTVKVYSDADCKNEITANSFDSHYDIKYGQAVFLTFEAKAGYSTDEKVGVHVTIGGQDKKFKWDSDKSKFILALTEDDMHSKDSLTITSVGEGFTEKADATAPTLGTNGTPGNIYVHDMSMSGANDAYIKVGETEEYKYEYSTDNGESWILLGEEADKNSAGCIADDLKAGTYLVRKVETDNYKASPALEITITDGSKATASGDVTGDGYTITTNPTEGASYGESATLVLTVAEGYYVPSGKNVTATVGETAGCTFEYKNDGDYAGKYTYTVSDVKTTGALSVTNVSGIVKVYNPTITADLKDVTVYEEQDATFNLTATDSGNYILSYKWEGKLKDGDWQVLTTSGADVARDKIAIKDGDLTIQGTTTKLDGSQYRCTVTNEKGEVTSKTATLTVKSKTSEDALTADDVTVVDESIDGADDGSITLKDELDYSKYEYSNDEGSSYTDLTSKALTDLADGTYYIRKKTTDTTSMKPSEALKVTVNKGKSVAEYVAAQSTDAYTLSVPEGTKYNDGNVTLTLTVKEGYYVPSSITSLKATVAGNENTEFKSGANSTYTLAITNANTPSVTVKDVVKVLKVHNPKITTDLEDVTAKAGGKQKFTVDAKDEVEDVDCIYCTLKYQWYIIKPDAENGEKITVGGTEATYTTTALKLSDNGAKYYCVITNEKGEVTSKVATLTVEPNLTVAYGPDKVLSGSEDDLKAAVKENLKNILGSDDYKLVNEGASAFVGLGANTLDTVDTADKNAVKNLVSGKTEGKYLSFYLKEAIDNGEVKDAEAALTRPVNVTIELSALGLTAPSNKVRTYTVVRVKDGKAEVVASTLSGTSLTFATDGDADYTYAIYYTENIKDGIQNDNGTLHYYKNGKIDTSVDDLVYDSNYGWVKVKNGSVDVKYNGLYNSETCGWWLVTGGKVNFEYNDLYCDSKVGWWKVSNGTVDFGYTGLYNSETCGWWLVTGGRVNFEYNGLYYDTNCGWWLVSGGTVNFGYNGLYYDTNCGWWLVSNGTVNFGYTDLYYDTNCGWWKVYGGTVDFGYTGWYGSPAFGNWYINGGQVVFF